MKFFYISLVLILLAFIAARFYFANQPKEVMPIDFSTLQLPETPNYCLAHGDKKTERMRPTLQFNLSPQELLLLWNNKIVEPFGLQLLRHNHHQTIYVIHSKIFAFPDVIHVEIKNVGKNKTELWIYSHAIYGYSDLGVNCKRMDRIINALTS